MLLIAVIVAAVLDLRRLLISGLLKTCWENAFLQTFAFANLLRNEAWRSSNCISTMFRATWLWRAVYLTSRQFIFVRWNSLVVVSATSNWKGRG